MASIHREKRSGKVVYRLQFYDKDNRRRSIRLGDRTKKAADTIKSRIEDLVSVSISGCAPSNDTAQWLSTLGEDMATKLAKAGFQTYVPRRDSAKLGEFLSSFIAARKIESAASTITNFEQVKRCLVDHFGADRDLRTITEADADDWRMTLIEKYAEATMSKLVKRARQIFKTALRRGLVGMNPFAEVKTGSEQNDARQHFIDHDTIEKVISASPDFEWKLIIALARYGGVRTPSETLALKWGDIDWENDRMTVPSQKTKKQGKPWRVVPLFPELRPYLSEAFDQAADGTEFVINRYRDRSSNLRTQFCRIIKKAGVTIWPRLFQNLRASRETELANEYPLHVVTAWLGNTPKVATKHYLQVTDDHFRKAAAGMGATVGAVSDCQGVNCTHSCTHSQSENPEESTILGVLGDLLAPRVGLEPNLVV
ncbi:tyrosine-type recombinase/integrase [Bythopirellula polymerisocia]|uniref:Phage integrase family protein n=1 Tax=Bythopirellula polymerisocia TaxID=2528003 RepID=A0A5C6CDI6_9BACT|nr:tyrosine-type recombinase/integrase [Bythopirellula polymerisocia]TWU21807.1 Phage integrase family protein [Bythopirellula polymerisocia]